MLDKVIENNRVCIIGEVVSEFTFSHEVFGEGFYIANVSVNRLSDMVDVIPLMISERLLDVTKDYRGRKIEVSGQFRSYNRHEGVKNKLVTTKSSIPNAAIRKIPLPAYFSDSCFSPAPR